MLCFAFILPLSSLFIFFFFFFFNDTATTEIYTLSLHDALPIWRYIWPQFKSPLVWDVFAILTYLTISSTFLYVGLIPDIAVLRDRETNPIRKRIFGVLSLGWRNSDRRSEEHTSELQSRQYLVCR